METKISDLIAQLETLKAKYGDVACVTIWQDKMGDTHVEDAEAIYTTESNRVRIV